MFSVKNSEWKNWSEAFINHPETILYPKSEQDVVDAMKKCKSESKNLRVIGAGHSFTPIAVSDGVLLSFKYLTGIDKIDYANKRVSIWAGTTLTSLGQLLHEHGFTMENLGDINLQTIAGAISTGTHGSGKNFGNLSTQVTEVTMVTPDGELLTISAQENSHLFHAAPLSLGLLGVIIKVEIQVINAHELVSVSRRSTMKKLFQNLQTLADSNRHFEFFWFPHTETIQVKTLNPVTDDHQEKIKTPSAFNDIVMENGALGLVSEISRRQPRLSKFISKAISMGIPTGKTFGNSFEMYATPRLVKFNEMEYSIPAEHMASALQDINYVIQKNNINVHFPVECRYVKGDDLWLSPSYQRDSAFIAVHMYKGMEYKPYFAAIEEVFKHYHGRPHWGKMHTLSKENLQKVYPKFNDFNSIREQFDPNGLLMNSYLERLFAK